MHLKARSIRMQHARNDNVGSRLFLVYRITEETFFRDIGNTCNTVLRWRVWQRNCSWQGIISTDKQKNVCILTCTRTACHCCGQPSWRRSDCGQWEVWRRHQNNATVRTLCFCHMQTHH